MILFVVILINKYFLLMPSYTIDTKNSTHFSLIKMNEDNFLWYTNKYIYYFFVSYGHYTQKILKRAHDLFTENFLEHNQHDSRSKT